MTDGKIRIPIPKRPESTTLVTPRQTAERYVDIMSLSAMIDGLVEGIAQSAMLRSKLEPKERTECMAHVRASLGAAVEVHRTELREAHIEEVLDRYTPEELYALVEFHDSTVGRQIRKKGPLDTIRQPTSKVLMKINHLAQSLLQDYGLSE